MTDPILSRLAQSVGDGFHLERELAGGGMARVFLARDRSLDRPVVVKALDLEGAATGSAERFRREMRLSAQLQHPHIVPVLAAGGDDRLLWYIMPFVSGESLRERLRREGALPVADALRLTREVLEALGVAHARGVVHRDVKPENILLEGGHALVADFGVAKALQDAGLGSGLTSAGMALGTPVYMAPEQAMADPTTNHRADLYAVGVVLYEMLVGAPPFSGSAQSVIAAHVSAEAPRVDERRREVPPAVSDIVTRLLAKVPADRPRDAADAMGLLDAAVTPAGTVPGVALRTVGAGASANARRKWIAVTGGVLTVAIAGTAMLLSPSANAVPYEDGADVIAVMPLGVTGDSALARLGRDLVVTVSANLDGVGLIRAVDAMSVVLKTRDLPTPISLDAARSAARDLGARSVLHGSLVAEGRSVRADLVLHPVDGGSPLARLQVTAPVDSIRPLTDSITSQLLRQVWRTGKAPSPLLSEVTTASNEALRAFLAGEAHINRLAWQSALAEYARATTADTSFAQAYLRIRQYREWSGLPPDPHVNGRLAMLGDKLPTRDRERLRIRSLSLTLGQYLDSARVFAARYPDSPDAQYLVGDAILHNGAFAGVPTREAIPFLDRVAALVPSMADVSAHRFWAFWRMGDTEEANRSMERLQALTKGGTGEA